MTYQNIAMCINSMVDKNLLIRVNAEVVAYTWLILLVSALNSSSSEVCCSQTMSVWLDSIACACVSPATEALQASIPSAQLRSNFKPPDAPHFLNQEAPRAQQLIMPEVLMVPHLGHFGMGIVGAALVKDAPVHMWAHTITQSSGSHASLS